MRSAFIRLCLASWLTLLLATLVFYQISDGLERVNDDAATYYVLALEMISSGSLLPEGWSYVNGDLMVWGKPFANALLHLLGLHGYTVFATVNVFAVISAFVVLLLLLLRLGVPPVSALFVAGIPAFPFSSAYFFHVASIGSYTVRFVYIGTILYLLLVAYFSSHQKRRHLFTTLFVLLVLSVAVIYENPARYLVYLLAPTLAATVTLWVRECGLRHQSRELPAGETLPAFRQFLALTVLATGSAVAAALYKATDFKNVEWAIATTLLPLEDFPKNAAISFYGLLKLIGVDWATGAKLSSPEGAGSIVRLALHPLLLILPVTYTWKKRWSLSSPHFFFCAFAIFGLGTTLFLLASTKLLAEGSASNQMVIRYCLPFFLLLLACNSLLWTYYSLGVRTALIAAMVSAIVFAVDQVGKWDTGKLYSERRTVIETLKDEGIKRAYAPYWSSHTISLLSSNEVKVRPIELSHDIRPFSGFQTPYWYEFRKEKTAVIIPENIESTFLKLITSSCPAPYSKQINVGGFKIYIYDQGFPVSRDAEKEYLRKICFSEASSRTVGKFDPQSGYLYVAPTAPAGFLHFGPYWQLDCGSYEARFDISTESGEPARGFVDVTANSGEKIFASAPFTNLPGKQTLSFENNRLGVKNFEFRVYSDQGSSLILKGIEIELTDGCAGK
jgi:hypothetical protein